MEPLNVPGANEQRDLFAQMQLAAYNRDWNTYQSVRRQLAMTGIRIDFDRDYQAQVAKAAA